jgi:alkanesulfonate monooxygenase SsuD/methylene tetrahydromethanopterin reductase-like flavin-dependent oxidoreductase (luciferase family)
MKFGIFDHMDRAKVPLGQQYEERLQLAQAYERAGFHAYHIAEHHGTPLGMSPSPSVFLSALAARTRRLRFGPLIYPLPMYNPLRLAEEICMLDQLSNGRLELGIGRGASQFELQYYGVDVATVQARYFEAYAILMQALAGGTLSYEGKFHSFRTVPIEFEPVQKPHPPLWYGPHNPETVVWPARNNVNIVSNLPSAGVRKITDRYRVEWGAAGHAGPLPFMAINRFLVLADSDDEAAAIAERAYDHWHTSFYRLWVVHGTAPNNVAYPRTFAEVEQMGYGIAGSPAKVRAMLLAQAEEAGINYLVCRFAFGDLTLAESQRSLDLFTRGVMPAFAGMQDAAE